MMKMAKKRISGSEDVKTSRYSFEGYNFGEALFRNKDSIKVIITILSGINFASALGGSYDWKTLAISLGAAVGMLGVKLLSDAIDYYFKEVK